VWRIFMRNIFCLKFWSLLLMAGLNFGPFSQIRSYLLTTGLILLLVFIHLSSIYGDNYHLKWLIIVYCLSPGGDGACCTLLSIVFPQVVMVLAVHYCILSFPRWWWCLLSTLVYYLSPGGNGACCPLLLLIVGDSGSFSVRSKAWCVAVVVL